MQTVNIAELKNNLSAYLERVRNGEEMEAEELEMAAAGLVRLPEKALPESFWKMPAPRVSDEDAIAAVRAERDES